jgi:hypothetical protein
MSPDVTPTAYQDDTVILLFMRCPPAQELGAPGWISTAPLEANRLLDPGAGCRESGS